MKGYKVFNPDWTCQDFQYEVGETYDLGESPMCCVRGFHFCEKAIDCFTFYDFDSANKVAEVEAFGKIDTDSFDGKFCTDKIKIVRELTWHEVLDLVNSGKNCTGKGNRGNCNTGDYNSGDYNSGNRNSGNGNTGNRNCGSYNTGAYNMGKRNSGTANSGNRNSGDYNSGDYNSGIRNRGTRNSGDYNSGDYNSGEMNSGKCNSGNGNSGNRNGGNYNSGNMNCGDWNSGKKNCGDMNRGNRNTGHENSGNYNTGNRNIGDYNTGDWNSASYSVGCFNTEDRPLYFFDKPTDMTLDTWRYSEACRLLSRFEFKPNIWLPQEHMSDEEKILHPDSEVTGGYLLVRKHKDCCREWWSCLTEKEKQIIKNIPNFDADKFYQITGIEVENTEVPYEEA